MRQSTRFRPNLPHEHRKALELRARLALAEVQSKPSAGGNELWDSWVPDFLKTVYSASPRTYVSYRGMWLSLREYFDVIGVNGPRQLRREHCLNYVPWRTAKGDINSPRKRPLNLNTVLQELRVLSRICNEAVRRGFCDFNPVSRLGIKRNPPREKREMTDEHVAIIRKEIERFTEEATLPRQKQIADFFRVSFEIALHQGCRMCETYFPMADVDFANAKLTVMAKGRMVHEPPLNPSLVPFLRELAADGRSHTYTPPRYPSLEWWKFFDELRRRYPGQFDRVSFHSLRVRTISTLARNGAPEHLVMKLVNHSSTTTHRIYRRINADELKAFWNCLTPKSGATPPDAAAAPTTPSTSPHPKRVPRPRNPKA